MGTLLELEKYDKARPAVDMLYSMFCVAGLRRVSEKLLEIRVLSDTDEDACEMFMDRFFDDETMPSLGMITLNALTAADEVIIPVQAQYLPAKGMTQLMKSISLVKSHTNENLKIAGIVMTLVDSRTNLAKDVIDTIRTNYGMAIKIFDAQIPIAVKAAEAAQNGQSIFAYDRSGKPAKAYGELVKEVIADAEREKQRDRASITR